MGTHYFYAGKGFPFFFPFPDPRVLITRNIAAAFSFSYFPFPILGEMVGSLLWNMSGDWHRKLTVVREREGGKRAFLLDDTPAFFFLVKIS